MLRTSKNTSIYTNFGRNRLIETIDNYVGTVHRGPFRMYRGRRILVDGQDDPVDKRYKNA